MSHIAPSAARTRSPLKRGVAPVDLQPRPLHLAVGQDRARSARRRATAPRRCRPAAVASPVPASSTASGEIVSAASDAQDVEPGREPRAAVRSEDPAEHRRRRPDGPERAIGLRAADRLVALRVDDRHPRPAVGGGDELLDLLDPAARARHLRRARVRPAPRTPRRSTTVLMLILQVASCRAAVAVVVAGLEQHRDLRPPPERERALDQAQPPCVEAQPLRRRVAPRAVGDSLLRPSAIVTEASTSAGSSARIRRPSRRSAASEICAPRGAAVRRGARPSQPCAESAGIVVRTSRRSLASHSTSPGPKASSERGQRRRHEGRPAVGRHRAPARSRPSVNHALPSDATATPSAPSLPASP